MADKINILSYIKRGKYFIVFTSEYYYIEEKRFIVNIVNIIDGNLIKMYEYDYY